MYGAPATTRTPCTRAASKLEPWWREGGSRRKTEREVAKPAGWIWQACRPIAGRDAADSSANEKGGRGRRRGEGGGRTTVNIWRNQRIDELFWGGDFIQWLPVWPPLTQKKNLTPPPSNTNKTTVVWGESILRTQQLLYRKYSIHNILHIYIPP